ncbi:hypothetical protein AKJ63_00355 [candidate division MSBL1 archaeon SCGC-AAA259D18]|uniref:JAB domain-containing protein n=1 Tax=candidate division MSBL1 archaeon SCGC-AAA259D18 TaxID=1698262 RepID=A0A133UCI4_9EURY|nr:hypothetical protein AKJ63_00355 [candidate division MSBL1 archaeon SCGC-AAA259D18]
MSIDEIDKEALKLILRASNSSHPNEFAGILRSKGNRITEVLILPGTFTSERSALMNLYMLPISSQSCGSVHSHSSSVPEPSRADLNFFDKFGEVHLIVASPYNESSWKAFNKAGKEVKLEIVESEDGDSTSSRYHEEFWT